MIHKHINNDKGTITCFDGCKIRLENCLPLNSNCNMKSIGETQEVWLHIVGIHLSLILAEFDQIQSQNESNLWFSIFNGKLSVRRTVPNFSMNIFLIQRDIKTNQFPSNAKCKTKSCLLNSTSCHQPLHKRQSFKMKVQKLCHAALRLSLKVFNTLLPPRNTGFPHFRTDKIP